MMSEYEVELFKREKFHRKKCPKCGRSFWTLGERLSCGEPPCEEYSFIGHSPIKRKFSLHEMRELYLKFFEKNGHRRISRYPIVARWRDDVFFTQASIYCFQPWVLLGVVKPPANPLAISQTCVRFNDIDNVGKTGRHFTMFEMMAHHAFNTKDNFVYFKDRTVELCHNLLAKELGISPEKISYIEAQWAGGGNSGPCFEVIVEGVELATLVFMMYEEKNGGKREMEMQVVDTGYGLERFTWLSQGTSSAYEAVFGEVLAKLKKDYKVGGDSRILSEYSKVAGLMKVESAGDHEKIKKEVAKRLSISGEELQKTITPLENIYALCDHTRALMFMLNDGVMPSNVKEGYFGRILVRRALRSMGYLGIDVPLSDIVKSQVNYFRKDFPEIRENGDEILKLVDVEEEKFKKTADRGKIIIKKLEEKIVSDGGDRIGFDNLIELYDSNGLTPDFVREFSSLKVKIPADFYNRVAQRHEPAEAEKKTETRVPNVAPTILGFYEDANIRKFDAKVVSRFDNYVILDKTYFYAEGGGQEPDHGKINGLNVVDVRKIGNVIVHKVEGDISRIPDKVSCGIDWDRRIQLMQHHTATHIINGAARKVLGSHVWQTGAHKGTEGARLDITHYAGLDEDEVRDIENLANKMVKEKREIEILFMERNDAEKKYGFRLYQGGAVPGGEIRVINIKDWDVEACGGLHFSNTTDVSLIKITSSKRIQDGVVRLEFVAGKALEEYMKTPQADEEMKRISAVFSVPVEQLTKTIGRFKSEWGMQLEELKKLESGTTEKFSEKYKKMPDADTCDSATRLFEEWKSQRNEIEALRQEAGKILRETLREKFRSGFEKKNDIKVVKEITRGLDVKTLADISKEIIEPDSILVLLNISGGSSNLIIASKSSLDAGETARNLSKLLGGGSHGNKEFAIGGGKSKDAEKILKEFKP